MLDISCIPWGVNFNTVPLFLSVKYLLKPNSAYDNGSWDIPNLPAYGATVPKNCVLLVTGIWPPSAEYIKSLSIGDLDILSSWNIKSWVSSAASFCIAPSCGSTDIVKPPSDSLNWFI